MSPESSAFFLFEIEGVSGPLDVLRFTGFEGMSQLYRFEVELSSADGNLAFDDALGKPALLTIHTIDESRFMHGIVSRFEETGTGTTRTVYTATVVPRLWTLGLRQDCCMFQTMNVPDVLKQVLEEAGLASGDDFELDLQEDYAPRDYCVQYRETDLDFISRLMEEEGIFYFFKHTDSGHKLVIADHSGAYDDIVGDGTIVYREGDDGMQGETEHLSHARFSRSMRPGKVMLRDFNFEKVDLDLGTHTDGSAETDLEIYDYPGRYADSDHGSTRTSVRVEALRAERDLFSGDSNCRRLSSGAKFTLAEHPRDDLNIEYLIVRVRHTGRQPQAAGADAGTGGGDDEKQMYENSLEAIPADVTFRAPMVTPKARIDGPQTAIVTGPSGEEIHCDEFGRVKVHFHWDRVGAPDDKSSCWVRVSQAWSGSGYGGMVIPRVGNEVIVSFLEGDPDQPLITGHVYNGAKTFHYTLPADKTRTSLKSYSSPGGDGFNELRFEDAAGSEEVFTHAQKDMNTKILNNRTTDIGVDHDHVVGNNETMKVGKNRTRDVGSNETITIGANHTESVAKDRSLSVDGSETIIVGKEESVDVGGGRTTAVGKDDKTSIGKNQTLDVSGDRAESITGKFTHSVGKSVSLSFGDVATLSIAKDSSIDIGGNAKEKIAKSMKVEVGDELVLECGSAKIVLKKNGDILIEGGKITVKASSELTLKGSKIGAN